MRAATAGLAAGDVHVWVASLDVAPGQLHAFRRTLDAGEEDEAAQLASPTGRRRFIARRGLRRAVLASYVGCDQRRGRSAPRGRRAPAPANTTGATAQLMAMAMTPRTTIVVMSSPLRRSQLRASSAGQTVCWEAEPDLIVKVLLAGTDGHALLPVGVARSMAQQAPLACGPESPTPEERQWLRTLATGVTVGQLARQIGYSERTLYRLLQSLYLRMGVSSRAEAIHKMRSTDASD